MNINAASWVPESRYEARGDGDYWQTERIVWKIFYSDHVSLCSGADRSATV